MTFLCNDPEQFADEALEGFVSAYPTYVRATRGGVVRSSEAPEGQVAILVGGGAGHFPAFAGWVGTGMAHGAACGNVFASPSVARVASVAKTVDRDAGILMVFGNYAGDVLNFGHAAQQLRADGTDVRIVAVTDDIASSPPDRIGDRRGIAGDLMVLKAAGAAAEQGASLDEVERVARLANERTRSIGIGFSGCRLPGANAPLFEVPKGTMSLGLGIHGEPGIADMSVASADDVADLLVDRLLEEAIEQDGEVALLLNGLGGVKYEELYAVYRRVARRIDDAGYSIVAPEVGELCTSLDMAGLSLTLMWLTDELRELWAAPCAAVSFRRGVVTGPAAVPAPGVAVADAADGDSAAVVGASTEDSRQLAARIASAFANVHEALRDAEPMLGALDAVAGDGDHGRGMLLGAHAAHEVAEILLSRGAGSRTVVQGAGEAWAERAGGTSGVLWGAAIAAMAGVLDDESRPTADAVRLAAEAAMTAVATMGGAVVGDKTMVDAMAPFCEALTTSWDGDDLSGSWLAAVRSAEEGAEATKAMVARRGRSRTHAEKSLGTPDPGAVSFVTIVKALTPSVGPAESDR